MSQTTVDASLALASDLRIAVARLARRLRGTETNGLTQSQLSALAGIERLEPVRLCDLAAAERVTAPTMTKIVAALEHRGLVVRETDPQDRRSSKLRLTREGRAALRRVRTKRNEALQHQLDRLSAAEREVLLAALPVLVALGDAEDLG